MKLSVESKQLRSAIRVARTVLDTDQICHIIPLDGKVLFYARGRATISIEFSTDSTKAPTLSFTLGQLERLLSPFTKGKVGVESLPDNTVAFRADKTTAKLNLVASDEKIDPTFSLDVVAIVDRHEFAAACKSMGAIAPSNNVRGFGEFTCISVRGNLVTLQATDGYKYGSSELLSKFNAHHDFLVQAKLLERIMEAWEGPSQILIARKGNAVALGQPDNYIVIPTGQSNFKLDPSKVRELLKTNYEAFLCNKEELLDAAEAAYNLYKKVRDAKLDVKIEIDISKWYIAISTCTCTWLNQNSQVGLDRITREIDFEIQTDHWHEDIRTIHFNAGFFIDTLKAVRSDKVVVWFGGQYQGLIFDPAENDVDDFFAVMPLGDTRKEKAPLATATGD